MHSAGVCCAGRDLECDFGFVGRDTTNSGRICVPYTPPPVGGACGKDGQHVCTGADPTCLILLTWNMPSCKEFAIYMR